jgi:FMN-dependent oxidoreductase (nitrilotriacetate monooxygenase family)
VTRRKDKMRLGAFLMATGHHVAAWRHPAAQADAGVNLPHYIEIAQVAERAGFDMMFLADTQGTLFDAAGRDAASRGALGTTFEPLTLLSAIAAVTSHIGLVATASTSFYPPFLLARMFASLDALSGGRAGWNLVTSATDLEARNFGRDRQPEPELRYAIAEEYADVVRGLWRSWEDDAFPRDKASGRFFDPAKVEPLDHRGAHFAVAGPLNVPRSPQGHPIVVQAGSSEAGRALAARTADIVFAAHQQMEDAQAFYADVKARLPRHGRTADAMKIMPGLFPIIGGSETEAQARYAELQELIHPDLSRHFLAAVFGLPELLDHPVDEPLPDWLQADGRRASRPALLLDMARREKLTARQLHLRVAGARGHHTLIGTPEQIADHLETWFDGHAADGFNIMPPHLPQGLTGFVEQVIPLLRRRGRFRTTYEGRTLRENLGLPFPTHPRAAG